MSIHEEREEPAYIRAQERILELANNKDEIDWRSILYKIIEDESIDPWDIDLGVLTGKYLETVREMKDVDFDVSGKFLTIAVFLLKSKAESYIERDLRGIDEKIASARNLGEEEFLDGLSEMEALDYELELQKAKRKREDYAIKYRNPVARKRKVNIFDLIKTLEKTFEQSNRRRANFFARKGDVEYEGPRYEKKSKDLKEIIEELYDEIHAEFESKKAHVTFFSHISRDVNHRKGILEKFLPLLHLHNHERVRIAQKEHFADIEIHKINKGE